MTVIGHSLQKPSSQSCLHNPPQMFSSDAQNRDFTSPHYPPLNTFVFAHQISPNRYDNSLHKGCSSAR
jgi:hypothetical protein